MVGAGNVATHLACALNEAGHTVTDVFSASEQSARALAEKTGSAWTTSPGRLPGASDFFIISVRDSAIESVVAGLGERQGMMLHTAGSAGMEIFKEQYSEYGVFYPFQTFRKEQDMDLSSVPFFIESNTEEGLLKIRTLAESISNNVINSNLRERVLLHLSAAFACNFTTYMVRVAESILKQHGIDRSLLTPLLEETFRKLLIGPADKMQTGPATRGDSITMKKHYELLAGNSDYQKLYNFISELIQKHDKL